MRKSICFALMLLLLSCGRQKQSAGGYEYVDLGLPSGTLWATCNVGAAEPEEYGDYFAWGETSPKENYSWDTYKYGKAQNQMTKYCRDSRLGLDSYEDGRCVLDSADDAALVSWGGKWRMPTEAEQDELRKECTWTWMTQNNVSGYKVTGPNGSSIFLPAAGILLGNGSARYAGERGCYWSSKFGDDDDSKASVVYFSPSRVDWGYSPRCYGYTVRAVMKN